jgi:hypothetical protein
MLVAMIDVKGEGQVPVILRPKRAADVRLLEMVISAIIRVWHNDFYR